MSNKKIPDISNLHMEKQIKDNIKNEMFNIVLTKIIEDINYTNRCTDKTYIIFEVPNIIIGFHNYNPISCIHYLIFQFTKKGYLVQFMEPDKLYIDWGTNKSTFNNIQDIIPTANPTKLKNQTNELLKKYPTASKVVYVYEDQERKKEKKKR
jgi:hypothetical protein